MSRGKVLFRFLILHRQLGNEPELSKSANSRHIELVLASQVWWYMLVIPSTQKAEEGGS